MRKLSPKYTSLAPVKDDILYEYAWYKDKDLNWDGFVVIVCVKTSASQASLRQLLQEGYMA